MSLSLHETVPWMFFADAPCNEGNPVVLGVPFALWSFAGFAVVGAGAVMALVVLLRREGAQGRNGCLGRSRRVAAGGRMRQGGHCGRCAEMRQRIGHRPFVGIVIPEFLLEDLPDQARHADIAFGSLDAVRLTSIGRSSRK